MNTLKALGRTETELRVGNYLVLWGDAGQRDLEGIASPQKNADGSLGEYFTPDTEFDSPYTKGVGRLAVDWEHRVAPDEGGPGADDILGYVDWSTAKADARGLWVERVLDRRNTYMKYLEQLIEAGLIGNSSEAIPSGVQKAADGRITRWPLRRDSLTVNPMEPRMMTENVVSAMKALTEALDALKAPLPEAAGDAAVEGATGGEAPVATNVNPLPNEEPEMEEQEMQAEVVEATPAVDVSAVAAEAAEKAVAEAMKAFRENLKEVKGGFAVPGATETKEDKAIKGFGTYVRTGVKAAMQEGTDSEGGYLVPTQYSNELVAALRDMSFLRMAGARVISVSGTDSFRVPAIDAYSAAAVLTAEEAAFDQKEPTVREVEFNPYKYTRLSKVSDELLADSRINVVGDVLVPDVAQAFAAAENAAFTTGTGTAQPQGVVTGATVGVTAASATAITADEVVDLYHALDYKYRPRAVWMMNDATAKLIRKLKDSDGQYLWQPGLQAGQPDRLLGRPVYTNNTMATAAVNAKTLLFGDLSYYWIADFAGLSMKRLEELYAANGQVGFRWYKRMDANVMLAEAIQVLQQAAA